MNPTLLRASVWALTLVAATVGVGSMLALVAADLPGDYVEGVVLSAQQDVRTGRALYAESNWSEPPYSINLYGPVYYHLGAWTAGLMGASPGDLLPGRLLSLASLILALAALWRLQRAVLDLDVADATLGVLLPLGAMPIVVFGAQYRVDVFGIACGLWGLVLAAEGGRKLYLAPILFVLAVYTKSTAIAAVFAVGLWWLLDRRFREILVVAAGCLVLGGIWLGTLAVITDGDFIQSVFGFNALPFSVGGFLAATQQGLGGGLPLVAAGLAAAMVLERSKPERLAGLFLLVALFLALATVGRMGANFNYFVETSLAVGPVIAVALARTRREPSSWCAAALPGIVAAALVGSLLWAGPRAVAEHRGRQHRAVIENRLAELIQPGDTIVTMEIVSAFRLDAECYTNDPFIFSRLAEKGLWEEERMITDMENGVITWMLADEDMAGPRPGHTNWTDAIRRTTAERFDLVETLGRLHLYRYREAPQPVPTPGVEEEPS
jgi:hypothetical protein